MLIKTIGSMMSGSGRSAKLNVLIYHRVLKTANSKYEGDVDAITFRWHIEVLCKYFTIISLADGIKGLQNNSLPARAICITFDDGYEDNFTVAFPILVSCNAPATFFVTTKYLNHGYMWNDGIKDAVWDSPRNELDLDSINFGQYNISTDGHKKSTTISLLNKLKYISVEERNDLVDAILEVAKVSAISDMMMSDEQVRKLHAAGMEIGGHTVSHPILFDLDEKSATQEIAEGKDYLEGIVAAKIDYFAYPNGKPNRDYKKSHVDIVRKLGFKGAVSTVWGTSKANSDVFQLPRFTPWDNTPTKFVFRLIGNYRRRNPTVA